MFYEDRDLLQTMKRNAIEMSEHNTWDEYGERYIRFLYNLISK